MKILKSISLTALLILSANVLKAQNNINSLILSGQFIEKLLTNRNFVFTTYFIGEDYTGRPILSPDYTFSISNNKIVAELPNIGSFYSNIAFTSFHPDVKLNSTNYYYKAIALNDANWRILIIPIKDRYIKEVIMNIAKNGYASLTIINNQSKTFNYNGKITPLEVSN